MKFFYFLFALLIDMKLSTSNTDEKDPDLSRKKPYLKETDIHFYLYTPTKYSAATDIWLDQSNFNSNHPVKIIIHGFTENAYVAWYKSIRMEYLKKDNYNIIEIDWSCKARNSTYSDAVFATLFVGRIVGDFLIKLHHTRKLDFQNVHVIGHSLGAHIGGYIGNRVYNETKTKIFRISGLDPARPLFEIPPNGGLNWLDASDATFVDIIHTDGGFLGFKNATGSVDFFPNGGFYIQPGCDVINFVDIVEYVCSHRKSHAYFTESINSKAYATKCSSWETFKTGACNSSEQILFGEQVNLDARGNFYLHTNTKRPYLKAVNKTEN